VAFVHKERDMTLTSSHSFAVTGGQNIDMFPATSELTVAQAARLLDMSEACIYELFKIDVLKYRKEGEQCWVNRDKLFEYKERRECRGVALAEMVRMNQEMGLYDD
jgi:hypothetical protein